MAYRVFPSGQVPTAEVLQKYLMNQAVITCVSSARPPTPVVGMVIFETDTAAFRVWSGGVWSLLAKVGTWEDDGDLSVTGNITATGGISAASAAITGAIESGGLMVSRVVKGKVGTSTVTTNISVSTDTNISSANVQNVPVISGRAYRTMVSIDYHRSSAGAESALDRLEFKLWNGSVGVNQLGGTARITMHGPLSAQNRHVNMAFIWAASSTETISNLNLSATVSGDNSVWTVEVNSAFSSIVEEIGLASTITNL